MVRQSRILDLKGKEPTPDAYILLRWMMKSPVEETEYAPVRDGKLEGDQRGAEAHTKLVRTECSS